MTALALAFARAYWKQLALAAALLALLGWHQLQVNRSWHAGRAALLAEQAAEAARRNANAEAADDAAAKCARDPECLRQSDGYRRD